MSHTIIRYISQSKSSLHRSALNCLFLSFSSFMGSPQPSLHVQFKKPKLTLYVNNKAKYQALNEQVRIQRGTGGPDPPGKSQVIWVSIGNKQLDPPPPPGKCWTPSRTLKNERFLWILPFDSCKISWGLKKRCQTDLDPPPPRRKFLDPRMNECTSTVYSLLISLRSFIPFTTFQRV